MGLHTKVTVIAGERTVLSTLWVFVMLNYLSCDIVGLMDHTLLNQYVSGVVNGMELTGCFLLAGALLMEIPMAMVLLSRLLKPRANRIVNMVAGIMMTLVQASSLVSTRPTIYYASFSVVEIAGTAAVFWYALKWHDPQTGTAAADDRGNSNEH